MEYINTRQLIELRYVETSQKVRDVGFLFRSPHIFKSFHKRTAGKARNLIQRPVCKGLRPIKAPSPLPLLLENRTGPF